MFDWLFSFSHKDTSTLFSVVHGMIDPTLCLDDEGQVLCVNGSAEVLLQYKEEEMIGRSLCVFFSELTTDNILTTGSLQNVQGERKDGSHFLVHLFIKEIALHPKNVFCVSLHDATKEEQEKKQKQEETDSNFLSMLSYELRTPLHTISGFISLLLQEIDGPLLPEQKETLRRIQSSLEQLSSLVKGLLYCLKEATPFFAFSKDLSSVTAALLFSLETMKGKLSPHITILSDLPEEPCIIEGSAKVLSQIFIWALQHVILKTEQGEIVVSARRKQQEVEVIIEDSEKNMSKEALRHTRSLLERFSLSQLEELDLLLAKAFVQLLGGRFFVFSQDPNGVTVKIVLPAYQQKNIQDKIEEK